MRNLKRALSLTLASVMLLSMMVVGSSAASYPDVSEEDNIEAIEVLQAVQVMRGDDKGNFNPDSPVTRAEMAVVMALLLDLDYQYYEATCPFTDVAAWARPYVGACYANGIVSGYSATTYGSNDGVTAVQAASMLMRALGYFKYASDYKDGFETATVRQASKIRLFDGVNANARDNLTRDQVARLALNGLKTPIVEAEDNTFDITSSTGNTSVTMTGGQVNYVVTASSQPYAKAIDDAETSGTGLNKVTGYIVELGEKLYNGDLKLIDDRTDDFGRPARQWEYDGKIIGNYAKNELLKAEYTVEVTGRELYDLLGNDVINSIKKGGSGEYTLTVTIDGETDPDVNEKLFNITAMNKNNKSGVGDTGNGVLTQVFVDGDRKTVDIAIINTYLARARADYSDKKDEVSFNVYGIDKDKDGNLVKVSDTRNSEDDGNDNRETMTVSGEDFVIDGIKENDAFLVTVADKEIQSMIAAEKVEDVTLTSFKRNDNVVADGATYKYANAAEYDFEVLDAYTTSGGSVNLKDKSYNLYLDKYGYLIGIDLVTADDNYVFISGIDDDNSNLAASYNEANAIFLDGTMEKITFNVSKSSSSLNADSLANTWCTYTKDSKDIYTLTQVAAKIDTANKVKVAQNNDITSVYIDQKHISLEASAGDKANNFNKIYGNDDTVYLTAELKTINEKSVLNRKTAIISSVTNVTTGVKNASLEIWNDGAATPAVSDTAAWAEGDKNANLPAGTATTGAYGTYALYKSNGYIIAAVAVADDSAASKNLVYVTSSSVDEESYNSETDEWTWTREVAINGEKGTIKEVSDSLTEIGTAKMKQYNWYEVKYNAKGEVVLATLAWSALDHATGATKALGNEYVDDIKNVEGSINAKDTVLFENSNYSGYEDTISSTALVDQPEGPSMKGSTFFVSKTDKEGFHVDSDVKAVFIQKNDNKTTTSWEEGSSKLESFTGDLNTNEDGEYNYEVSAILEGGSAKVVVIRDLNGTGDSGSKPAKPTETSDIYVDLRKADDILVNSKSAFTDDEGFEAIVAALEAEKYTIVNAELIDDGNSAKDGMFVVTTKKGSVTRTFTWDIKTDTNTKEEAGVAFTIDGVAKITNGTDTADVDTELAWGASVTPDDNTYVRYKAKGETDWTYVTDKTGADNVTITEGMEIETGYYKIQVSGANVADDTSLNRAKSGIVADSSGVTYALATSSAVKGSAATGTGLLVNSDKYFAYGSTFADIYKQCGSASGVINMTINQVALTIVNETVGSGGKTIKPVAYSADAGSHDGDIGNDGTMMYLDNSSTAVAITETFAYDKDHTVRVGYVKATIGDSSVVWAGKDDAITITWSVANNAVVKVGDKITATVVIPTAQKLTGGASGNTLTPSGAASFGCDVSGATAEGATGWGSNKFTLDKDKTLEGTLKFEFTTGSTNANATPVLTWA